MTRLSLIKRHKVWLALILLLLFCIPASQIIELLSLQLNVSLFELLQQPWRLFTGHLVHASWQHLIANLANLILLGIVFLHWPPTRLTVTFLVFTSLVISIGLWLLGDLVSYVGFSGVFHGLLVWLLLYYHQQASRIYTLVIIMVIGKIIYEQWFGTSASLEKFIGVTVAIDAHALGVGAAFIFWIAHKFFYEKRNSKTYS